MMKVKFSSPSGVVTIRDNASEMMLKSLPAGWKAEVIDEEAELKSMMDKGRIPAWMISLPSSYMRNIEQPFSHCNDDAGVVIDEDADKKSKEELI